MTTRHTSLSRCAPVLQRPREGRPFVCEEKKNGGCHFPWGERNRFGKSLLKGWRTFCCKRGMPSSQEFWSESLCGLFKVFRAELEFAGRLHCGIETLELREGKVCRRKVKHNQELGCGFLKEDLPLSSSESTLVLVFLKHCLFPRQRRPRSKTCFC